MKTEVIIDPACNFLYSSYYIKGLYDLYNRKIHFSSSPFEGLRYHEDTHVFAFVLKDSSGSRNIVIDFGDSPIIEESFLEWSDVYGKINLNRSMFSNDNKIRSIAPGFAIKIWSKPKATLLAVLNYQKGYQRINDFRQFLSNYLSSTNRCYLYNKPSFTTTDDYIFFYSTFWVSQDITNINRVNFIRACKEFSNITFEGGLVTNEINDSNSNNDIITNKRLDHNYYIKKVRQSILVFNTPAYHLCHGWKLAEYLALGKAIISTPLINELPEPLIHKENIFFVSEDPLEMRFAIELLHKNIGLRKKIEQGAYKYYLRFVSPQQSIKLLL